MWILLFTCVYNYHMWYFKFTCELYYSHVIRMYHLAPKIDEEAENSELSITCDLFCSHVNLIFHMCYIHHLYLLLGTQDRWCCCEFEFLITCDFFYSHVKFIFHMCYILDLDVLYNDRITCVHFGSHVIISVHMWSNMICM